MICYLETHLGIDPGFTGKIFPYIGCGRKSCFFCEAFRVAHDKFSMRGTQEIVFPRWILPQELAATRDIGTVFMS